MGSLGLALSADGLSPQTPFEKPKGLAGRWEGSVDTPEGPATVVEYRVTAAGKTVMEILFPGTEFEMVSVYYLDGDELIAKHFCAMGNRQARGIRSRSRSSSTFDGQKAVLYRSRMNPSLGRNLEAMDPLEWGARLADQIPDPRQTSHPLLCPLRQPCTRRAAVREEPLLPKLGAAHRQGLSGGSARLQTLRWPAQGRGLQIETNPA